MMPKGRNRTRRPFRNRSAGVVAGQDFDGAVGQAGEDGVTVRAEPKGGFILKWVS